MTSALESRVYPADPDGLGQGEGEGAARPKGAAGAGASAGAGAGAGAGPCLKEAAGWEVGPVRGPPDQGREGGGEMRDREGSET